MAFIGELCSDFPAGYQTIAALDGNDALVSSKLGVGHDETGKHIDPAIPTGLVRVGSAYRKSVSWNYGCNGFLATERVPVSGPNLLATCNFVDATEPQFVFLSTQTDTTSEFAYDGYYLAAASRTEATMLQNPMVAVWRENFTGGVDFGLEYPPQPQLPDLNSIMDGDTFSRVRATEVTRGVITKLTALAGAGADRVVQVSNDGSLAAVLVSSGLVDGTVATADLVAALAARVAALERQVARPSLNGDFEDYTAPNFDNWTVHAGSISTGNDSTVGRYITLNSSSPITEVYSALFALPLRSPFTLKWTAQATAVGTGMSMRMRWFDYSQSLISETIIGPATQSAANTWENFSGTATPPSGARFGIINMKYEANTPKIGWVLLDS